MTYLNSLATQADPGSTMFDAGKLRLYADGYGNAGSFTTSVIENGDNDWYKVALKEGTTYQFNVNAQQGKPGMTIRGFLGQYQEPMYSKYLSNSDLSVRFQPPVDGLYYLDVDSIRRGIYSSPSQRMTYNLSVIGEMLDAPSKEEKERPVKTESSSDYVLVEGPTWSEAQAAAEALGGNLVSINSKTEQDLLESQFASTLATQPLWIGLTDQDLEGDFTWLDNSVIDFTNWADTEPNGGVSENFTFMYPNGTWNDSANAREFMFKGIAEIPVLLDPGSTPAPVDETNDGGTTITINGDVYGDVIIGDGNTINKGVTVIDGRRWDTLRGDDGDNVIGYEEGLDRMRMKGGDGVDTFVLGDYTDNKQVSTWVRDFNDDFIGFDLTSLGLDDAVVGQADNRREFRELRSGDENIIMYNNKVYSDLNGESKGLGGGELFAKIQGDDVSLSDIAVMDV